MTTLRSASDPTRVVENLIRDRTPDAGAGPISPDLVLNRLIRKTGAPVPQQAAVAAPEPQDFSKFGTPADQVEPAGDLSKFGHPANGNLAGATAPLAENAAPAAQAPKAPEDDFAKFGTPVEAPPQPSTLDTAGSEFAQRAVTQAGQQMKGAAVGLQGITPSMVDTGGGEGPMPYEVPPTPQQDPRLNPIYRGGQAVEQAGRTMFPTTPAQDQSFTGAVAGGLGNLAGMAPGMIAGSAIGGPAGGIAAGAMQMGAQSAGSTFDDAIAKGATPEVAAQAAGLSALVGGGLGALPLGAILNPIRQTSPGFMGFAAAKLEEAARSGMVFATVGEVQEWLGKQIEQTFYDPKAEYAPDAKRVVASLLTGAIASAAAPPYRPKGPARTASAGALPGPDAQQGGQQAPGSPPGGPGAAPGGPPQDLGAMRRKMMDDHYEARQRGEKLRRSRPKRIGTISSPHRASATRPAEAPPETSAQPEAPKAPEGAAAKPDDNAVLRDAGYSDDAIARWTPEQRAARLSELTDQDEPPSGTGTREDPIPVRTADDVQRAEQVIDQDHTHEQGEANNVQRAHVTWEDIPITLEAPEGGVRRGLTPEGERWQSRMGAAYGYIKGTEGGDGQHVDVFLGPNPEQRQNAFVLDELDRDTGKFRQHKVFIGFDNVGAAVRAYQQSQGKSIEDIAGIGELSIPELKEWLRNPEATKKPVGDHLKGSEQPAESAAESSGGARPEAQEPKTEVPVEKALEPESNAQPAEKADETLPEHAEPTLGRVEPEHHEAVEAELRSAQVDPDQIRPADIARAAEIVAHEGRDPADAFPIAVVRNLVDDGLMTPEQVRTTYGDNAEAILGAREPSERGVQPETPSAATRGAAPQSEGGRTGEQPARGGEAGALQGAEAPEGEGRHGREPNAGREAGGAGDHGGATGGLEPARVPEGSRGGEEPETRERPARAPARPRVITEPISLLPFIAGHGGLKSTPDLRHLGLTSQSRAVAPNKGPRPLLHPDGLSLDHLVERMRESGYLPDADENAPPETLHNDVIAMIDDELRGNQQHFPAGTQGEGRHARERGEDESRALELRDAEGRLDDWPDENQIPRDTVLPADRVFAAELMLDGMSPDRRARAGADAERARRTATRRAKSLATTKSRRPKMILTAEQHTRKARDLRRQSEAALGKKKQDLLKRASLHMALARVQRKAGTSTASPPKSTPTTRTRSWNRHALAEGALGLQRHMAGA